MSIYNIPMKSRDVAAIVSVMAAMMFIVASPMAFAIDADDVSVVSFEDELKIDAGTSKSFNMVITNVLTGGIDDNRIVILSICCPEGVNASISEPQFLLEPGDNRVVPIVLSADRYAHAQTSNLQIDVTLRNSINGDIVTKSVLVDVEITSHLSSQGSFNKILGMFENPLPEPFDKPLATAIISFVLLSVILGLLFIAIANVLVRTIWRDEDDKDLKVGVRKFLTMFALLFAFEQSLRIYGASEEIVGNVDMWATILYVVLGAIIVWKAYMFTIHHALRRVSHGIVSGSNAMDLEPLFRLIGKMLIAVVSVAAIMTVLGFSLAAIITSAGVLSLGITLGAQNVLNQFFSGVVVLWTHPFEVDDLIKINNSEIYKVVQVKVMNTVLEDWDTGAQVTLPNNAVASATIQNLTANGLIAKILLPVQLSYSADVNLAKEIMLDAAMNEREVVKDTPSKSPYTTVIALEDGDVILRLTAYAVDINNRTSVRGRIYEAILSGFVANKIAFSTLDVSLKSE